MNSNIFRRNICLVLLCLCALVAMPLGKIVTRGVRLLPNDMTGQMSHVKDHMGRDTYLLKVKLPYPGAIFDGMVKYEYLASEYHVWMEDGNKWLDIRFPGCESAQINLQELLGEPLVSPRTYELTLDLDALGYHDVESQSSHRRGHNYAVFTISPVVPGAELVIAGATLSFDAGRVETPQLPQGDYTYIVNVPNYLQSNGKVYIKSDGIVTENVFLRSIGPASEPDGYINKHGYVDLGLPSGIMWATCNIGANSPSDYGDYFAWGEIAPKSTYIDENCSTYGQEITSDISGNPMMDVSRAQWESTWRLPTTEEFDELSTKCAWLWTTQDGHTGYKVIGPNGNSIFLPAAGMFVGPSLNFGGKYGYYWSSMPNRSYNSRLFSFSNDERSLGWFGRSSGVSVRPVAEIVPVFGTLPVLIEPNGSEVKVDGKFVGFTPLILEELRIGNHRIEVSKSGYETFVDTVKVNNDADNPALTVKLAAIQKQIDKSRSSFDNVTHKTRNDDADGYINGYGYVDLGLPSGTKWATCNVGAVSPTDYGDYFAWGEISTKSSYSEDNCLLSYEEVDVNDISSDLFMDPARGKWGATWRLPTRVECKELKTQCTWTRTSDGGYRVTGPNGRSIFFPAAGQRFGPQLVSEGTFGYYWSSTRGREDTAFALLLFSTLHLTDMSCYKGFSVRPVSE